jgi:hypothetical protein
MISSLSASDRSAGPILAAHPQVRDMPIKVFFLRKNMKIPLQPLRLFRGSKLHTIESVSLAIAVNRAQIKSILSI